MEQEGMDNINQKIFEEISEVTGVCIDDVIKDYAVLVEDCIITGNLGIVDSPRGENQHEESGVFTSVYVDQIILDIDYYVGEIYGKFMENKWLIIPYEC